MKLSILNNFLSKDNSRSAIVKRNILGSGGLKVINVLISLVVVPLTIDYVDANRYGIWLTLSTIIAWASYFDLGLGHGFRNKLTEALASDNLILAQKLVSTVYITLSAIFSVIMVLILIINNFLNWGYLLNISASYNNELKLVFEIMAFCFCINCVANTFNIMLIASQHAALASFVQTITQITGLVGILIVTHCTEPGLVWLAVAYTVLPSITLVLISVIAFNLTKYRNFRPRFSLFRKKLIREILGLGGKFFIIMFSTLLIFQCINIIISRIAGPLEVTQYNVTYKYFNVTHMLLVIILTPFWSAFTDAYVKKDYKWMKSMQHRLEQMGLVCVCVIAVMCLIAKYVIALWIGDTVTVATSTVIIVGSYILFMNLGDIYMYLINGTGKVTLQMIVYIVFAIVSIPLMLLLGHRFGLIGIIGVPTFAFFCQTILARIQLIKIINGTATSIFNR